MSLICGIDEVGRGCGAGPVVAAAVILPEDYANSEIKDSKKMSEKSRITVAETIKEFAIDWAVAEIDNQIVDEVNILQATYMAMHKAISDLYVTPNKLLVDGNQFLAYDNIPHECIVKGDSKEVSIAAASILAKVHRDELMKEYHKKYPNYDWESNKGYLTEKHRSAIKEHGLTEYHRKSFKI